MEWAGKVESNLMRVSTVAALEKKSASNGRNNILAR